jgi:penicillin G amidase
MKLASAVSWALLGALVVPLACHSSSGGASPPSLGPFGASPPVGSTLSLANLSGPVDVVRDTHGMVHIYATTIPDALRAEGYMVSKDRTAQVELIRRSAEGRLAELLGDTEPDLIDQDIAIRMIGLARAGKATYDLLQPTDELKSWLDAYADGISQFNARLQTGDESLPKSMIGVSPMAFTPWEGWEALAIGRLQSENLSYDGDNDLAGTEFVTAVNAVFNATATNSDYQKRAGFLRDTFRFAPVDPTTILPGFPNDANLTMDVKGPPAMPAVPTPTVPRDVLASTKAWRTALRAVRNRVAPPGFFGSNDWVVAPSKTASGHAMVANDPHLSLSAPSVFWMVQLNAPDASGDPTKAIDVTGLEFPGIPGIILGFNDHVAWGATTAGFDVTDDYTETLTPDGGSVVFNGQNVALQTIPETINIAGGDSFVYDVLDVPQHGPIVPTIVNHRVVAPDPTKPAISIKWTGMQPTNELQAVAGYMRAQTVEDARVAVRNFAVGAQNWVFADDQGNIFYTAQSQIPIRDKRAYTWNASAFTGTLPAFVLPGDGTCEWTGQYLDESFVPHAKNPSAGYIGTANGDPVGVTLDDDPSNDTLPNGQSVYIGSEFDPGLRQGQVHKLIENVGHPITPTDMATIQANVQSSFGLRLTPVLLAAIADAQAEVATPGTHPDLTAIVTSARYQAANVPALANLLTQWGTTLAYDARAGVSLDDGSPSTDPNEVLGAQATLVFNSWLVQMIASTFNDELGVVGDSDPDLVVALWYLLTTPPAQTATYDAATGQSAIFDDLTTPTVTETSDSLAVTSLLDVVDFLNTKLGSDQSQWLWGTLHTLRFASLVSLWDSLSIPPIGDSVFPNGFPRHGDGYNIDVGDYDHTPDALADVDFTYGSGPTQRFVIDVSSAGSTPFNVLPGGEIWDNASPHFRDEAELWRRNENHPVAYSHADVLAAAESRMQFVVGK